MRLSLKLNVDLKSPKMTHNKTRVIFLVINHPTREKQNRNFGSKSPWFFNNAIDKMNELPFEDTMLSLKNKKL